MSDVSSTFTNMKVITKRELNQQTAKVLAEVEADEVVIVTERGQPKWQLTRVDFVMDPLIQLQLEGKVTPPSGDAPPWPDGVVEPNPGRIEELLAWSKGDR